MTASVTIQDNLSLTFKVYQNSSPLLKERFVNTVEGRWTHLEKALQFDVLKDINLSVSAGERVGIIGFNGAGKSTLMKVILGIYQPDSGKVIVSGSITPLLDLTGHFDFELTGRDNMYLKGSYLGYSKNEMKSLERSVVEFSELKEFFDIPVKYYSSGMVGRLAFAIATMLHADVLLLDEVFAVGDGYFVDKATKRMMGLINYSQIVLMVSHNVEHIRDICTRVIWMHKGRIVGDGGVEEMLARYKEFIESKSETPGLQPLPAELKR